METLERIQKTKKNKNHPLAHPVQKTERSTRFSSSRLYPVAIANNKIPTESGPRGPSLTYSSTRKPS